ncbi:uncharacterized protein EI90DRAFT_3035253 [Cantharellus anzutake]|uniref:uncharacterized protein n=1 Tax=Cantharellus anzutake TaxID=1750568 RepID=UPI0019039778|nr:uncharacterized protein EI90DRAFT_3035253 [Cantharellus anzutake]KAF8340345.1 hypothetical protein EI90DRAFT_3035253 [Cantharellus anzutake]
MKTRRKSKPGNGETLDTTTLHPESQASESGTASIGFEVDIPDDVDMSALDNLFPGFPLSSPTPDTVVSMYRTLLAQGLTIDALEKEKDQARADVLRLEVELDQALQDHEVQISQMRTSIEQVHSELEATQNESRQLATARSTLEVQVESLTQVTTSTSTETEELRRGVAKIEAEKRDLLSVVDSQRESLMQRDEENQHLRTKHKELRIEISQLQSELAEAKSNENASKFHSYTLEQEANLLREENQRHMVEFNALQESSTTERRSKHAEIVKLQSEVDTLTQENASIESRFSTLQKAHRAQETQLMESLSKGRALQAELSQQTAQFRAESGTRERLVELMDRRNDESRRRVEEIEREWDAVLAKASATEDSLREELMKERQRNEELEARLQELRIAGERIGPADGMSTPVGGRLITSTPGSSSSPFLSLSPTASLATRLQKSGRSYTEVYADYIKMGEELTRQKEETRRLETALAQILSDIEERAPLIQSQRVEYSRATEELAQLANQLAQTSAERDELARSAEDSASLAKKLREENETLERQLSDLGRQVQALLREVSVHEDPSLGGVGFDLPEDTIEDTDSDQVITNHLVLFKSLPQLQQQNQRLLKTARGLAAQWEKRQADIETEWCKEETQALAEASEAVKEMEEELQRQKVLSAAHQRERDMYRNLLTRQGRDPGAGSSTEATSAPAGTGEGDSSGYRRLLEEQQSLFEAFKTEMGVDSTKLKEDLARAQRDLGQLSAQLAKANAQIDFLQERIKIAQNSAELQSQENTNLQKRNQQLQETVGKTEIRSYHVSEELRDVKVTMERLRSENASLQAENNFLRAFEARLQEENKNLSKERAQLKDLVGNIQAIQAELERSGESEKRRQESQIKHLESQTQDLREQLNKQSEESRRTLLQKDLELGDLHSRVESLTNNLFKSKEGLSIAETSRGHLQTRVDDLLRQLQGASSKLSVYERHPGAHDDVPPSARDLSEEEQLRAEVADLSAALKVAEGDLARAHEHVDQFKNISQANEAALESLNETFEEYKLETEKRITSLTNEVQRLKEQYDHTQQELTTALREHSELSQQLDAQRLEFEIDRRTLEATIADFSTVEDKAYASQKSIQEDLRRQAQLAQDAHEKYSRELVAHAESMKHINVLKEELADAQGKAREYQTQAETAIARANTSESTWTSQKEALTKEMEEISSRCKDLISQNAALHQHLETVSSQATKIRQAVEASPGVAPPADANGKDSDNAVAELRAVISFVRREKEIAELQLDLHKQENTRLKSYSDHLAQSLEATRNLLKEEREKASQSATSAEQHADLMEKINQLNLLRESNTTLRSEAEANSAAAHDLRIKLQKAQSEVEPLKERVRVLEAELKAREDHIHRLEEDNKRLKDRTEQILSKHHRVDPAEVQSLRDEVVSLKTEHGELKGQIEAKDAQIERLKEALQTAKAAHSKLFNETRVRFTSLNDQNAQLTSQLESSKQLVVSLEAEKTSLEARLAEQNTSGETQANTASELSATVALLEAERDALLSEKNAMAAQGTSPEVNALRAQFEKEIADAKETQQLMNNRNDMMKRDNVKFKNEIKALELQLSSLRKAQEATVAEGNVAGGENTALDVQELVARRIAEATAAHERDKSQAITAAIEDFKKDTVPRSELEAEAQRRAAELKALEERMTASHQAEVQTARVAVASDQSISEVEVETKIAEARGKWEAEELGQLRIKIEGELAAQHLADIEAAKVSVTRELEAKQKAKDAQMNRLRAEVEKLKKQIADLTKPSSSNLPASASAASKHSPATPTAPALPVKLIPTAPANSPTTQGAIRGQAAARGRGVGRGAGRGGSQVLQNVNATIAAATPQSTSQPPTSIIGAASGPQAAKRPRESETPEGPQGDAKRPRGGAPVINRSRLPAQPKPATPQDQPPS